MFRRSSGMLLHISSLHGDYGIGSFGKNAREFADLLSKMGFSAWQVLPFGPVDEHNSPYKCYSAFAGNPYFIDLEILEGKNLLTSEELQENMRRDNPHVADFEFIRETRINVLKKAYSRIDKAYIQKIKGFENKNAHWLPDYALFMALRKRYNGVSWQEWEDTDVRLYETEAIELAKKELSSDIMFWKFIQYEFYIQWTELKKYVNSLGIEIIGDMPIYVSDDSADVWSRGELFSLDKNGRQKRVAGVPPDYFSADGQLWGNPLYNWTKMKKDDYSWWIKRIEQSLKMFDAVRIDHFRGFASYWSVDAKSKTAKDGRWEKGPGMKLFNIVKKTFGNAKIIAEDLGDIDQNVRDFLAETGFPGMNVMQFGFLGGDNSTHLPHNYIKNSVSYTGTHDNNTTYGFLSEVSDGLREFALEYCRLNCNSNWRDGGFYSHSVRAIITTLWQSTTNLAIIPMQDLCGFGSDTRMNTPGVANGNWAFRVTMDILDNIDAHWISQLNKTYARGNKFLLKK